MREALFSIWQERLPGSRFLDLFAGSGAVGLEAAGRGASEVVCIEDSARAARILEENRSRLGEEAVTLRRGSLPGALEVLGSFGSFDLVFADPPYDTEGYGALLEAAARHLASGGAAAVEHARRVELPEEVPGLVRTERRVYGETALSFYRATADEEPGQ